MEINADFSRRVLINTATAPWVASPMVGVDRRMFDRIGDEVARATSIVRYAPNSHFSPHVHSGGEEFIVLDGVFQDEHGDYPAGYYIRNPPTTRHIPRSARGCTIFVKLWQFDPDDRTEVKIDMNALHLLAELGRPGVTGATLFEDARETVRCERWQAGTSVVIDAPGGAELLVLDGSLSESGQTLARHDWLRVPMGGAIRAVAGEAGAHVWIKTRHLRHVNAPAG